MGHKCGSLAEIECESIWVTVLLGGGSVLGRTAWRRMEALVLLAWDWVTHSPRTPAPGREQEVQVV